MPQMTVRDYFDRALQRTRMPRTGDPGELIEADNRLAARFFIETEGTRIAAADYLATTCVVLLAYCERLRELVRDTELETALRLGTADLVAEFPEVPAARRDRADLVISAFRSAVQTAASLPNATS
jgi:hypothetical protein